MHVSSGCEWLLLSIIYVNLLLLEQSVIVTADLSQNFTVLENQPAGTVVGKIGTGIPSAVGPYVTYFMPTSDAGYLAVSTDGTITTKVPLNRTTKSVYIFIAVASTLTINVIVTVIGSSNNNGPVFQPSYTNFTILETTPVNTHFFLGSAIDPDLGMFGVQSYNIVSGNGAGTFNLSSKTAPNGVLTISMVLIQRLDHSGSPAYSLVIRAYDGGTPPKFGDLRVNITVIDVNNNQPIFNVTRYFAQVAENASIGSSVLQVYATDRDIRQNGFITYSFDQQRSVGYTDFTLNPATGVISVASGLSYARTSSYELIVVATDRGQVPLQATAVVQIQVLVVSHGVGGGSKSSQPDIQLLFLSDDGTAKIPRSANPNSYVAHVTVLDPDKSQTPATFNVTLLGGDGYFGLTRTGNIFYLVVVSKSLITASALYQMSIIAVASNQPSRFAVVNFTLSIVDYASGGAGGGGSDPNFSQSSYSAEVHPDDLPGAVVTQVGVIYSSLGQNEVFIYRLAVSSVSHYQFFRIDRSMGIITTRQPVTCQSAGYYNLTVFALRMNGLLTLQTLTTSVTVYFHPVKLDISPRFDRPFYTVLLPSGTPVSGCILTVNQLLVFG